MRTSYVALASAAASLTLSSGGFAQTAPPPSSPPPAPETTTAQPSPSPPPPVQPPQPAPAPAAAPIATSPPSPPPSGINVTTLEGLRAQGTISNSEYDEAVREIGASTGSAHAGEANSLVLGKWATTLYGFIEGDSIYDSTQSFTDVAGNAQVLRPSGSTAPFVSNFSSLPPGATQPLQPTQGYLGSHGQTLFSVRNSRIGFRLRAPGTATVHTSALLEMDFLGDQPSGVSSSSYFTSPTMRVRHAAFRVETPVVDILVGQYWHLFGWMEGYLPNTTEIQGVPGQLYARAPQVRVSKAFRGSFATFEAAIAAVRPPSLSELPEGEAGLRLSFNKWTGLHTAGATGTSILPASIAVSGDARYYEVAEAASVLPTSMVRVMSGAGSADLYLPIVPATDDRKDNALSIIGQAVYGSGISDLYSGMQSGVMFPFVPYSTATTQNLGGPAWPTNMDQGLVSYDITPGGFALHPVQWTSVIAGLEYYLPMTHGRVWVSGNYSHIESNNTSQFARALTDTPVPTEYFYPASTAQVRKSEDWWDANLFFDPVTSVRVGLEYAQFYDHYVDGFTASNTRVQASGFFIF